MSRIRIVGGKINKITGGNYNLYSGRNTNITALGKNNFKAGNTIYGNNPKVPVIETVEEARVKTIICLDDLDDGAANNGNIGEIQKGAIYGKSYRFEISEFIDKEPISDSSIRWKVSCTDLETGDTYDNILKDKFYRGKSISIHFGVNKFCGHIITVKAFIQDEETEGRIPIFYHNRFRWFDREIIKDEIKDRINTGKNIDQGESSMCGVALIGHYLAIQKPNEYKKIILDLHRKGKTVITDTDYEIKIDSDEHLLEVKPMDSKYPKDSSSQQIMSFADYVFLFTIKDHLNVIFDYDPDGPNVGGLVEGLTGLTFPNEIKIMMKEILFYTDVKEETNLVTSKWSSAKNSYTDLLNLLVNDYSIAFFINADNFTKDKKSKFTIPNHWVGLKNIFIDEVKQTITVIVFTWGEVSKRWTVSFDVFENGYFGYVAGK